MAYKSDDRLRSSTDASWCSETDKTVGERRKIPLEAALPIFQNLSDGSAFPDRK
jgi:hypothetical protein